jgi:prepilin-type N-terminal cleavage/methylation domain-containing protein
MIRRVRKFHPAFTLIEMMLAVAVLGLILVMLAGSFHAVAASKLHAEGHLYADREGRAVLWQLSNEIRGAVQTSDAPSHVLLLGAAQYVGGAPINSLTVSTLDPGHRRSLDGFGAEEIVTYRAMPNPGHPGLFILQRDQQSGLSYGSAPGNSIAIANNVLALRFRYFDGNQWTEVWNSQNLSAEDQLPIAIAIDLKLAAPGGHEMAFSTEVTVPMAIQQW